MATRRSEHLPRLSLATGFNLNLQQPAMFSPALPTAVQHNFHPGFPLANPLQTPVQSFFNAPVAPSRPTHRQNQASIQLAAAGIHPPNFIMTPVASHFPRPSIALALPGPPQPQAPPSHPFPGRSRRQLSIGGPPKAVLGGPARKTSPLPPGTPGPNPTPAAPEKKKKVIVNLPKETIEGEDGRPTTRPDWARPPLTEFNYVDVPVILAESSTADIYPPEEWRTQLPYTIDVYLPGKVAWETLKRKDIEDKLEKLGVERGSGSNVPHIHAPHARAASISSPADPALLLFKLNKLQQAQQDSTTNSAANSLSVSPQPPSLQPYGLTPSPHRMAPNRLGINHGHTLSLAQPLSYPSSLFSHSPSPFGGSNGVVDNEFGQPLSLNGMHSHMSLDYDPPPLSAVGAPAPKSQVDFMRGFGLDVPLESEEEDEEGREAHDVLDTDHSEDEEQKEEDGNRTQDMELDDDTLLERGPALEIDDATTTGPQSRLHSRHVSRVSAALSLSSVGGNFQAQFESAEKELGTKDAFENGEAQVNQRVEEGEGQNRDEPQEEEEEEVQRPVDPTEEWTGSEDACFGAEASEVESIGSFSNPSDEERARQDRSERRIRRRAARQRAIDQPRRLPEFPRPPGNTLMFPSGGREEDIISNPSEENLILARRAEFLGVSTESYYAESTSTSASVLGLHAAPHSRMASEEYSAHDPALAHSRQASGPQQHYHQHTRAFHHQHHRGFGFTSNETNSNSDNGDNDSQHQHQSIPSKKNPLNPSAKPFVFGPSGGNTGSGNRTSSGTWEPFQGEATPPMPLPTLSTHSRMPSFGKPLSASAPEFKPGQFNFRLPGAPQMPPAPPPPPPPTLPPAPPLLGIPNDTSSPFRMQGREKRQRRDSNASMEEGGSLASFRFPPLKESSPKAVVGRRHRSGSLDMGWEIIDQAKTRLSSAEPFTFAGFSAVANNMPLVPKEGDSATTRLGEEDGPNVSSTTTTARPLAVGDVEVDEGQELLIPPVSASKPKRAPIPLDFKHPTNTVPAGLFKALASNGDERTRRGVRSRLNSREIFEHIHRPSMDDTNVPLIARKASRNRLGTDPGEIGSGRQHVDEDDDDDVFTSIRPHVRRRSSLPDALVERPSSPSPSDSSVAPQDLTSRMELHHVESVIAQLLDEKLTPLYDELTRREAKEEAGNTESMMAELIALFRAQLRDGAAKRLEDSQMDARGELDFQLIKEVVEESHQELLSSFQREVHRIAQQTDTSSGQLHHGAPEVISAIDGASKRTVSAVVEALSEFSARQDAAALNAPARERDLMVEKLVNVLSPMMDSLHTDPIDYEFLTRELAQAVKPHIAQLIDLASDKRETAGLIVDRILPLLPTLNNVSIDTDAITLKLTTEVRRAIAPIDAFEIKEQVADLVVERLDSRLAVRDKTFNVDIVTSRVTEGVSTLLETLNSVPAAVEQLSAAQKATSEKQETVADTQTQILASITDVPAKIESRLEQLTTVQENILDKLSQPTASPDADPNIFLIRNAVESLEKGQAVLDQQNQEALAQAKSFSEKLDALPETFTTLTSSLQQALTELVTSNDSSKRELEEVRKLNTEYQFQLTKARSSHGQVRVEKDMLDEKLSHVQEDRDRLLAQVKDLESSASVKAMETSAIEARNAELEDALAKALARLQDADVAAQSNQSTIANLEKAHKEVVAERDSLKAKVAAVEAEVTFASREKDTVTGHLENLQRQHDQLVSQQSNWEALNAASEKINLVYKLLENADEEDQQELRQQRERSRALDMENAALQKRVKDAELKLSSAEKTATTALQTLSHAQQRSTEWERCAKDYEGQLEMVRTKLEQAEQSYLQLEADYNMAKVQIEEHEADNRLVQDRENKLREQIAALETKCSRLQDELEKANSAAKSSASPSPFRSHNGVPPRPDSRASTVYDVRDSAASNRRIVSSASVTSSLTYNQPSVRDSIHAPSPNQNGQGKWSSGSTSIHTPPGRYPDYVPPTPKPRRSPYGQYNTRAPSPTPSVASTAPTRDADGWFI